MDERPPPVWLPSLGHGAHILAWLLHDTGDWWALLRVSALAPQVADFARTDFITWDLCAHQSLVQPRAGWDYTQVPRFRCS